MKRRMFALSMLLLMVGAGSSAYFSHSDLARLSIQQKVEYAVSQLPSTTTKTYNRGIQSSVDTIVYFLADLLCIASVAVAVSYVRSYPTFKYRNTALQLAPDREKSLRRGRDDIL